jgi:protein TonB
MNADAFLHADGPDAEEPAETEPLLIEPAVILRTPPEKLFDWNRDAGLVSAALLHGGILLLLLLGARFEKPPIIPEAIPVEVVTLPPARPPQQQQQQQQPQRPAPAPKKQPILRSGGDLEKVAPGQPDAQAPTGPQPAAAPPSDAKAKTDETAMLPPPPTPPAPPSPSAAPTAEPDTTPPASSNQHQKALKSSSAPLHSAPLTPKHQQQARAKEDDAFIGAGGGDKYLNSLRDEILRHRTYPPEIRALGLDGTAQYEIVLNRGGELLRLRLLHSSGVDVLDHAGLVMIQRTAPFQPLPDYMEGDAVQLVITLHMAP